ncbi:MAG: hypothetical protein LBT11_02480 [Treponema sp.]|jgi:hypothetical protein|nr:hypothetical protein [Treponema sp.]
MMRLVTAHIDDGECSLEGVALFCGRDISVTICGGAEHIGAVALGIARPSLRDPEKTSASVSVICVTGHKDDELARVAADYFAATYNCVVSTSVGIHVDEAGADHLERIIDNFTKLLKFLSDAIVTTFHV